MSDQDQSREQKNPTFDPEQTVDRPLVGSAAGESVSPSSSMRPAVGARVEFVAQEIDEGGLGVGIARAIEVRAGHVLPGERVEIEVEHVSPHEPRVWGRVTRRLSRISRERVTPPCPGFGSCGGCLWQHLAYSAQLEHKARRVTRALRQAGVAFDPDRVAAIVGAPRTEGYRTVAKYVVARGGEAAGEIVLGSYAPRSHRVVDMAGCRVVEPVIDRVCHAARHALAGIPVYDESAGGDQTGVLRYVAVRTGLDRKVVVALVGTSQGAEPEMFDAICRAGEELADHPDVSGVLWMQNDADSGVIFAGESECLFGRDSVVERVAGVDIEVGVDGFFQVNRAQAARLYAEVTRLAGREAARVIDLYCGVGGIAFALAAAVPGRQVLGIERNEDAVRAAQIAAVRAVLGDRVLFRAADAQKITRLCAEIYRQHGADLIVVNPPRKGLDEETRAALRVLVPPRLIYVSCNPESLARDLAQVIGPATGYRIDEIVPLDLMPGTAHVETVVALSRNE